MTRETSTTIYSGNKLISIGGRIKNITINIANDVGLNAVAGTINNDVIDAGNGSDFVVKLNPKDNNQADLTLKGKVNVIVVKEIRKVKLFGSAIINKISTKLDRGL